MARVKTLQAIEKLLQQALDKTERLHEAQEIDNPTDASDRTEEACDDIEGHIVDAIDAIAVAIADLEARA